MRAATPSQAAELAVPDRQEIKRYAMALQLRLQNRWKSALQEKRSRLALSLNRAVMRSPQRMLAERRQQLDGTMEKLLILTQKGMVEKKHALELQLGRLDSMSPLRVLRRGYGVVEAEGTVVRSVDAVKNGTQIRVILSDGALQAGVTSVEKGDAVHG